MALITDINQVLRTEPGNLDSYLRYIQSDGVTTGERCFVLRDRNTMNQLRNALGLKRALAVAAALMEGSFEWRGPGQNGFYTELYNRFIMQDGNRGVGAFLNRNQMQQTLNCWESVLVGLFVIGYVNDQQIYNNIYRVLETEAGLPNPQVWNALGYNTVQECQRVPGNPPRPGMLLYYVPANHGRLTQSYPNHIAVSIGNNQAVSLWTQPHGINAAQRISVINEFPNHRVFLGDPARIFN